jgi:hypothetical protein
MIVGLSGLAGAGKSTVARILASRHRFVEIALADRIKRMCREAFAFTDAQLWGASELRNEVDKRYNGLTPRRALQELGTAYGRSLWPDIWIERALKDACEALFVDGATYRMDVGIQYGPSVGGKPAGVVLSDIRFANECSLVRSAGGVVWRIIRAGAGLVGDGAGHPSETSLTDEMFSRSEQVVNDGTVTQLSERVAIRLSELSIPDEVA